jgi:hypothetical protein
MPKMIQNSAPSQRDIFSHSHSIRVSENRKISRASQEILIRKFVRKSKPSGHPDLCEKLAEMKERPWLEVCKGKTDDRTFTDFPRAAHGTPLVVAGASRSNPRQLATTAFMTTQTDNTE